MLRVGLDEDAHAVEACAIPLRAGRDRPDNRQLTDRM